MKIDFKDFDDIDINSLKDEILASEELEIYFRLDSIGSTNNPVDIVNDYCEVSFYCERIAPFIKVIESEIVPRNTYFKDFRISCIAVDAENLINELIYFFNLYDDSPEIDDLDRASFYDELSDYENSFNKRVFEFPELVNGYWANLIHGAYWVMASESYDSEAKFFNKVYRKNPEHRFGFWKSPLSTKSIEPIYFSTENWIIPPKTNLVNALRLYSGFENDLKIEDADKIEFKNSIILINNSTAVHFNQMEQLVNSIKCSEIVLSKIHTDKKSQSKLEKDYIVIHPSLFNDDRFKKTLKRTFRNRDKFQIDESKIKFQLSEYGDLITAHYKDFVYVFFSFDPLNFEEIKELNEHLNPVYSKIQNLINSSISGKCDWSELNDDKFEELCYDILYCHPFFDSSTIQKMGKSKSRDGGRDILIKTRRTPTKDPELYVFQCKFYSNSTSLSASKIPNAGNVIMQYGAKGYGVFTTTVIDSTLYDMLDGFNRNLNIDTSICMSKYELERHLNRNQMIKNKYFKTSAT